MERKKGITNSNRGGNIIDASKGSSDNSTYREQNDLTNPVGSVVYDVRGEGGQSRHRGDFYSNNPYLNDLYQANNNEDKDALYERAIEWDADWYNLQEQRAYDRQVLEEQRAYDDPAAQIARQRRAGINPDITAGSGSNGSGSAGSSAQLAQRAIADQQGQTKFANKYDNTSMVFQGIGLATDLVGTLSNGYSSIMNSISQMKILPSQIALNEANAGLASSQANEIQSLLEGKKRSIEVDNVGKYLSQVNQLRQLLVPEFTDEQGINLLKTMGYSESDIPTLMQSVRDVHKNPQIIADFEASQLEARRNSIANKFYDDDVVERMTNLARDTELMTLQFQYADNALMSSVQTALLSNDDYTSDLIETELNRAQVDKGQSDIAVQNMMRDAESWGRLWDEKMQMCKFAKGHLDALKETALKDGKWTELERANYNTAWMNYMTIRDGLSTEFASMRNSFIEVLQKRFENSIWIDSKGQINNMDFIGALNAFSQITFDDNFLNLPSGGEIVRNWISTSSGAVRDLSLAVGGGVAGYNQVKGMMP